MFKTFFFFILLPFAALSQVTISGRVINHADNKPVADASVFLSNATIGDRTTANGTFILHNVKPGKYDLIVSIIGFETHSEIVLVNNDNVLIQDIVIVPKTIVLNEVSVRPNPNRERYYSWFKEEFLGTSDLAAECKILNPEVLDLDYDEKTNTLKASSSDFLEIENAALGYKIKYLLSNFMIDNKDKIAQKIYYAGSVLFEELKGTPVQERRWQKKRQEVYEASAMHFLRSALSNRMEEEGFRALRLLTYPNPERPSDSLIDARIKSFKKSRPGDVNRRDSLSFWVNKSKLPKTLKKLMPFPLNKGDIIKRTDQQGLFALGCDNDALYITYDKNHHFPIKGKLDHLDNHGNKETTIISFNEPYAFFDSNGVVANPYSIAFNGVWSRNRVAGLLPLDYETTHDSNTQSDSTVLKNVSSKIKSFSSGHIVEKAYLHFDKPYYAAGDTIYFKAYITLGGEHRLSNLSGVLHVDLINPGNRIDQSIKLQVINGIAWGDFALPDTLKKGSYRVRAYTRWMLNEGQGSFFDQTIPVGSVVNSKIPESENITAAVANTKPDIHFFPEGGSMVNGVRMKVAFKAIDINGMGIDLKGELLDNQNRAVLSFSSVHLGMGYFYVTPTEGQTYRAKIIYSNGTKDIVDLPVPEVKGVNVVIADFLSGFTINIYSNKAYYQENRGKSYTINVYSAGIDTSFVCKLDSQVIILDILKSELHTGIAKVTLFSPTGEPLSERLLFVQNNDQLKMSLSSDKIKYAKREKVNVKLNVKDVAEDLSAGHFSVSVIDETKVPVDENTEHTILTNLLLTSELKGYIEQPNYYFINATEKTAGYLDLVMLTHGYRRFEWKQLLNNGYMATTYQREKGLEIAGVANTLTGKPLADGVVSLISPKGGALLTMQTDNKGEFLFSDLAFTDSTKFILQAVNAKGKNTTQLFYNKDTPLPVTMTKIEAKNDAIYLVMQPYLDNREKQLNENYGPVTGRMLKVVNIRERKRADDYRSSNPGGPGHADQVIHAKEIEMGGGSLSHRLLGHTRGIQWMPAGSGFVPVTNLDPQRRPMSIILDGQPVPKGFTIDDINPANVETVEILMGANESIYGINGGGTGILVVTTKQGGRNANDIPSAGILPITVTGFYKAREFYSPKYEHPNDNINRKDLRSTIYWKPELVTDKDGNASFEYYNADGTGSYRVVIEGIDKDGNIGRQVYRYKVQ